MSNDTARFHTKYRPQTLDEVIGHTKVVTQLKGFINSGKFPSALLITGPTGAGKTTIARAFARDVNGSLSDSSFLELNMAEGRGIDDVRALIQTAKLRPVGAPRRFILCDEVHQLVSNAPAASAFLKPLEDPVSTTTYLLCSMEPEKFSSSQTGRALAKRCVHLQLQAPTDLEKLKMAKRIARGEEMGFVTKEILAKVAEASDSMRDVANALEQLSAYYEGLTEKPDKLSEEDLSSSLSMLGTDDNLSAVKILESVYYGKFEDSFNEILDTTDSFGLLNKLVFLNWFMLTMVVRNGEAHPKVWGTKPAWALLKKFNEGLELKKSQKVSLLATVNARLVTLRSDAQTFVVDEKIALASALWALRAELELLKR